MSWTFNKATMSIDIEAATEVELRAALRDCDACIGGEYPETEHGTYAAMRRATAIKAALWRRFSTPELERVAKSRHAFLSLGEPWEALSDDARLMYADSALETMGIVEFVDMLKLELQPWQKVVLSRIEASQGRWVLPR